MPPAPASPCESPPATQCSVLAEPLSAVPWAGGFVAGVIVTILSQLVCSRLKPGSKATSSATKPQGIRSEPRMI